jgi:hypothetical protein
MSAGSFLWKMERLGLTSRLHRRLAWDDWNYDWFITEEGRDLLKEANDDPGD